MLLLDGFYNGEEQQAAQGAGGWGAFSRLDAAYQVPEPQGEDDYEDDYDGSVEPDGSDEGPGPDEEAEALGDLYASQYE